MEPLPLWLGNTQSAIDAACAHLGRDEVLEPSKVVAQIQQHLKVAIACAPASVPTLDTPGVATATGPVLVRCRGMVQDLAQETLIGYLDAETHADGTRRVSLFGDCSSATSSAFDVSVMHVVPVPGESAPGGPKQTPTVQRRARSKKRDADGDAVPVAQEDRMDTDTAPPQTDTFARVDRALNCVASSEQLRSTYRCSYVVSLPCFGGDADVPKANDVIDLWGILEPLVMCEGDAEKAAKAQDDFFNLQQFDHLPASLARRVSGLLWQPARPDVPVGPLQAAAFTEPRQSLLTYLTEVACGDSVAAELMLVQMVARVRGRAPVVSGVVPLNISGLSETAAERISSALTSLFSPCVHYAVDAKILCNDDWVPEKDQEHGSLKSGKLQLGAGTLVLFNEMEMKCDKVTGRGCTNLQALQTFCREQVVRYQFDFCEVPFNTDCGVISLSKAPSLLRIRHNCPLRGQETSAPVPQPHADMVHMWRRYLGTCRAMDLSVDRELENCMSKDTAAAATEFPEAFCSSALITEHTAHQWMAVAFGIAASQGKTDVGESDWARAVQLGRELLSRRTPLKPSVPVP